MSCFWQNAVVFNSVIRRARPEPRKGSSSAEKTFMVWILVQIQRQMFLRELWVQPAVPCDSVLCLWLAIDSKTHRFSPSQCLLTAASNPLRLPLVHGAGEAASLVRAIPSLTASHLNRPEAHHHPSQQNLSQLPRSHRSAIPPPESLLCWCSLRDSSLHGPRRSSRTWTWIQTKSRRALHSKS